MDFMPLITTNRRALQYNIGLWKTLSSVYGKLIFILIVAFYSSKIPDMIHNESIIKEMQVIVYCCIHVQLEI